MHPSIPTLQPTRMASAMSLGIAAALEAPMAGVCIADVIGRWRPQACSRRGTFLVWHQVRPVAGVRAVSAGSFAGAIEVAASRTGASTEGPMCRAAIALASEKPASLKLTPKRADT